MGPIRGSSNFLKTPLFITSSMTYRIQLTPEAQMRWPELKKLEGSGDTEVPILDVRSFECPVVGRAAHNLNPI